MTTLAPAGARRRDLSLPRICLHLPVRNDPPELVRRSLEALAGLEYPDFEVLVVSHNTADPALWEPVAEHCARLGRRFRFYHLGRFPGGRAGALNYALKETAPDVTLVGVLAPGDIAAPDWLRRLAPAFAAPGLGLVGAPAGDVDGDVDGHANGDGPGAAGPLLIRHAALLDGRHAARAAHERAWADRDGAEDAALRLRLLCQGWEVADAPPGLAHRVAAGDFAARRRLHARRARGAMQVMRGHWRALFSPFCRDLGPRERWRLLAAWLPWVGDALGLGLLAGSLAWSAAMILAPGRVAPPLLALMLPAVALLAGRMAGLAGRRTLLTGLALLPATGRAAWRGLLPRMAGLADRGAPDRATARKDQLLLVLAWAALAGVALRHRMPGWEAAFWCAGLAWQSLPLLAAVLAPSLDRGMEKPAFGQRHPALRLRDATQG